MSTIYRDIENIKKGNARTFGTKTQEPSLSLATWPLSRLVGDSKIILPPKPKHSNRICLGFFLHALWTKSNWEEIVLHLKVVTHGPLLKKKHQRCGLTECLLQVFGSEDVSYTYSLVLLGGLEMGYLGEGLPLGHDAASMAPPRMSRKEPAQAIKMAEPNSYLWTDRREKISG